jgi:hypothetical protein
MTFNVILMLCALGQSPEECQPPTARSVMVLEKGVRSEIACMREFALSAAKVPGLYDPAHEYPKLACERVEDESL